MPTGGRSLFDATLRCLLYGTIAFVLVVSQLQARNDPDFFWHLKSGEWIWQHRTLPATDPFNFMNQAAVSDWRTHFTLRAYWLAQLGFHLVHEFLGMPGIAALKLLLGFLIVAAQFVILRGDRAVYAALVLVTVLLFGMYTFDRPQTFSFLFFALLLAILERERASPAAPASWRSHLPLPLLMLLWGNMHGGHGLGQAVILLFMTLEGVKFAHPSLRPMNQGRYRRLLVIGGAGLAAALVNPNSWHAIQAAVVSVPTWMVNQEYKSTLAFFNDQKLVVIFWGALVLTALALLAARRSFDITAIALLGGLGYQGFLHVRYIPFFMIAALPVIGAWLSAALPKDWQRQLIVAGSIILVATTVGRALPSREKVARSLRVNEQIYPVGAADFVLANAPRGNLYNTYFWGGYLLWRLGPERKVFVDGRCLTSQSVFQAYTISNAFSTPSDVPPLWKRLLQQYGIGYLIVPRVDSYGGIWFDDAARLRAALLASPEWVPVFADAVSLVFVKNAPEHREIIRRHGIPIEGPVGGRPGASEPVPKVR